MQDITDYLDHEQKQEIAAEVFRERVQEALKSDRQVTNYLYDMTEETIDHALQEHIGAGWTEKIVEHVKGALKNDKLAFYIFRKADRWGNKDGPGIKHMNAAVEKHAGRIETRVLEAIDGLDAYDLSDLLRHALVSRLGGDSDHANR